MDIKKEQYDFIQEQNEKEQNKKEKNRNEQAFEPVIEEFTVKTAPVHTFSY